MAKEPWLVDGADEMLLHVSKLPPLVRVSKLAGLFDMARQRVYELLEMGELRGCKVGPRAIRITRGSVEDFLRRRAADLPVGGVRAEARAQRVKRGRVGPWE